MPDDYKIDARTAFILEEYKAIRQRISSDIDEINRNEVYFSTIIGAIYAVVLSSNITDRTILVCLAWFVFIINMIWWQRYNAHREMIQIHERFIKKFIEVQFLNKPKCPAYIGFMTYYDENKRSTLKFARITVLILSTLMSIIFLTIVYFHFDPLTSVLFKYGALE